MAEFFSDLDWSPLIISLKTGVIATVISFFSGIYVARLVMRSKSRTRAIIDGILTLPMVLPPTVAGFILLLVFSVNRPFGSMLYNTFDIRVVQSFLGCIIAATVIAFPLMYRNARAAYEQVDEDLIYAAKTLGMSNTKIFWRIVLPNAKHGIIAGIVLTFARAMGEYGATAMLAGNIPGKTGTISQRIAMVVQNGDYRDAGFWVGILLIVSFIVIITFNLIVNRKRRNTKRW
ncbi:MAG: molybdate ABC transporter permease subunit [Butyrivibrio sp.]|nr:molybdate ABC transporter permease subunit [Butyrivibrio sp.]